MDAGFMHLAWTCPMIESFWHQIFFKLSEITQDTIHPDPLLALLGYSKKLKKSIRCLIDMGLLVAKRVLAIHWSRGSPPTIAQWSRDMIYCNTQTEAYSELLSPRSRPKIFWSLYNDHMTAQPQESPATTSPTQGT